ncbi:hypothetical protein [Micromonospora sp. NPDC049374]
MPSTMSPINRAAPDEADAVQLLKTAPSCRDEFGQLSDTLSGNSTIIR